MGQIPVKFKAVEAIFRREGISDRELLAILKREYPLDRNISAGWLEACLLSLKAAGIIGLSRADADRNGNLILRYRITEYGKSRMKYITG